MNDEDTVQATGPLPYVHLSYHEAHWPEARSRRDADARWLRANGYQAVAAKRVSPFTGGTIYTLRGVRLDYSGPVISDEYTAVHPSRTIESLATAP